MNISKNQRKSIMAHKFIKLSGVKIILYTRLTIISKEPIHGKINKNNFIYNKKISFHIRILEYFLNFPFF